ncbi:hypothetical protein GCM10023144_13410 [Pigmentiphaga soli]|uniref:AB hydrolase-1 domain-containing protein n=1 Tax=Pigmentiphaga soli TaxID=1007095 RepID=A0ABP8GQ27_9BURK
MMAARMRAFIAGVLVLGALVAWALSPRLGVAGAVAASAGLAVGLHALAVAIGFAIAARRCRGPDAPPAWGWLRALPGEAALSMRNMYLDIPWRHRWPPRLPAGARGSVLLVHGYGCNRGIWRGLDTWLARRGWAVDAPDLEPPHAGIDDFGAQVAAAAARLAARTGHPAVVVVAHSMGGLAARAALCQSPQAPIAHLITLGTPHHGTWSARYGRGECAPQMLPASPWLRALAGREQAGAADRLTCIASLHDNVVAPARQALVDGAPQLVRGGVGHMALLSDRAVRNYLDGRLQALHPRA